MNSKGFITFSAFLALFEGLEHESPLLRRPTYCPYFPDFTFMLAIIGDPKRHPNN